MPIELTCTGCSQTLRVGDDHAGKKARCPKCGTISTVPMATGFPTPAPSAASPFDAGRPTEEAANPFADLPEPSPNPYQSPASPMGVRPSRYYKPHRGGLVLTFGILGLVCSCGILGIVAWVMGAADLKEIQTGRMDPSGHGLTQAGMILGIISTILMIVSFLFYGFIIAAGGM
jgi:hypothetical protein